MICSSSKCRWKVRNYYEGTVHRVEVIIIALYKSMTPTSWALYISSSLMFDKRYRKTGKDPEDVSRAFKVWKSYNTRSDQAAWDFSSWKSNGRRSIKRVHGREQLLSVSSRTQKFSKENLLHKGLKQFKEAFIYRSYSSAMETLYAEHCNCWKFTSIKKKISQHWKNLQEISAKETVEIMMKLLYLRYPQLQIYLCREGVLLKPVASG